MEIRFFFLCKLERSWVEGIGATYVFIDGVSLSLRQFIREVPVPLVDIVAHNGRGWREKVQISDMVRMSVCAYDKADVRRF